jgi:uncharacterized pyridoxamine 5'-phosphate oxidase family protein
MTQAAGLIEFLHHNRRAFLFCRDESGRPIGYAMQSVGCDLTSLYFSTYTNSPKVKHLRADPAAACIVLSGQDVMVQPWVSLRGSAEVYLPAVDEIDEMIGAGTPDGRVPHAVVAKVRDRLISGKRCFIRLVIEEVCAHVT